MKGPCAVATTSNITLSGEQTIDGVTTSESRVLVNGQTDQTENGIYNTATGAWTRAADFSRNDDVREGAMVRVTDGANAGLYVLTTANPITLGTSNIVFALDSDAAGGDLLGANNLSDIADPFTALRNLMENGTTIVCANPLVLTDAGGDVVEVSGSTNFSAVTLAEGKGQWVRFTGAPTITVGASLIGNNNAADITIEAGDWCYFRGFASNVVKFLHFPVRTRFSDASFRVVGSADKTKQFAIETDGFTTGQTRTMTPPNSDFTPAALDVADQTVTGGARVTPIDLGTPTAASTVTLDPGDRPQQYLTNNAAFTLAPGSNNGTVQLQITNGASAGAITTSGYTKVVGAFTTTNGDDFLCTSTVLNGFSLLTIQALQ